MMSYRFEVTWRGREIIESKLEMLELLNDQLLHMTDPDDMRSCVAGLYEFYKKRLVEKDNEISELEEKDAEKRNTEKSKCLDCKHFDVPKKRCSLFDVPKERCGLFEPYKEGEE